MDKEDINNISEEEITKEGQLIRNIHCNECDYETGQMSLKNGVFKVNMQGGYYMFDGEGGAITKCPGCGKDTLTTLD